MAAGDLRFLLGLGLTVDQLAQRTGRTRTAIVNELRNDDEQEASGANEK